MIFIKKIKADVELCSSTERNDHFEFLCIESVYFVLIKNYNFLCHTKIFIESSEKKVACSGLSHIRKVINMYELF